MTAPDRHAGDDHRESHGDEAATLPTVSEKAGFDILAVA
jgi:hypothetical protein